MSQKFGVFWNRDGQVLRVASGPDDNWAIGGEATIGAAVEALDPATAVFKATTEGYWSAELENLAEAVRLLIFYWDGDRETARIIVDSVSSLSKMLDSRIDVNEEFLDRVGKLYPDLLSTQ